MLIYDFKRGRGLIMTTWNDQVTQSSNLGSGNFRKRNGNNKFANKRKKREMRNVGGILGNAPI